MVIGNTIYQFIFTHQIAMVTLLQAVCIPKVSYVSVVYCAYSCCIYEVPIMNNTAIRSLNRLVIV